MACTVSDNGLGIAAEDLDKIFDPFFTTREQGIGLGLSTTYGFIRQSGGDIQVKSIRGQGTTFTICLPVSSQLPQQDTPRPPVSSPGGDEPVLVVEDDEDVRLYACTMLARAGYQVSSAACGQEALSLLEKKHFSLLFSDVIMPGGMYGPELAEQARRLDGELKILFTSGYTANAAKQHGPVMNENPFLPKPYQKEQLLEAVRSAIQS